MAQYMHTFVETKTRKVILPTRDQKVVAKLLADNNLGTAIVSDTAEPVTIQVLSTREVLDLNSIVASAAKHASSLEVHAA